MLYSTEPYNDPDLYKEEEHEDEKRGMLGWLNKHAMIVLTESEYRPRHIIIVADE
jgi:hypothetical protein